MFKYITAAALGLSLVSTSFAEEFKLPEEKPVVAITFPDGWETEEFEGGYEGTSEDGEVYLAVEAVDAQGVEKSLEAAIEFLAEKGVKADAETVKQKEGKIGGMDVVEISLKGTDEEGACNVQILVIAATEEQGVLVTYWASPEGEKKNQADLEKITKSIKKL